MIERGGRPVRRPHPYFGFQVKNPVMSRSSDGGRCPHEPWMTPEREEGILWAAFRQDNELASTDS